jgi:hypothetical protein
MFAVTDADELANKFSNGCKWYGGGGGLLFARGIRHLASVLQIVPR